MRFFIVFILICHAVFAQAAPQNWDTVRRDAELKVKKDLAGSRFVFRWDTFDLPTLPACARVHYHWPGEAKGKIFVQARCEGPQTWQVRLPAWVSLIGNIAFASRTLSKETVLQAEHLTWQEVELARYPDDVLHREDEALGRLVKQSVLGGQVLRKAYLRSSYAVQRLQTVKVRVVMSTFSITSEGVAQNNAAEGEMVKVKVRSGALIEGIARAGGVVEISP